MSQTPLEHGGRHTFDGATVVDVVVVDDALDDDDDHVDDESVDVRFESLELWKLF